MVNTLIVGEAGAGKTTKLRELLTTVSLNVQIYLCDEGDAARYGIPHNQIISLVETEIDSYLVKNKPSLIAIESINRFKDIEVPLDIPIYATMQAHNKEDALKVLKQNNIGITFENILEVKRNPSVGTFGRANRGLSYKYL